MANKKELSKELIPENAIKALLRLAPLNPSKDCRRFTKQIGKEDLVALYNRVLRLEKLSNKELLHYVSIIKSWPTDGPYNGLDLDALVGLKFPGQDRYLGPLAVAYFSIVNSVYERLSTSQQIELLYRYLYLFANGLGGDAGLYECFSFFLRKGLLDLFIFRRFYLGFSFLKEFVVDFREMGTRLVKIGYEVPALRELVYNLVRDLPDSGASWIAQHWGFYEDISIAELFYRFDCEALLGDLGEERLSRAEGLLACLSSGFAIHGHRLNAEALLISADPLSAIVNGDAGCANCEYGISVEARLAAKEGLHRQIRAFNSAPNLNGLDPAILRLSSLTDLRALGECLCKPSNEPILSAFLDSFDFSGIDVLEALRALFSSLYLIGEAQIIERVVRLFTAAYLSQNGLSGEKTEKDYKSAVYSMVALNTMLHNPALEKRPTFEEYLRHLRYTDGFVLAQDELRCFYDSIKANEIKLPTAWVDSHDKYLLSRAKEGCGSKLSGSLPGDSSIPLCASCILLAYQTLFPRCFKSHLSTPPLEFARACRLAGTAEHLEAYIHANKGNASVALAASKAYLECFIASEKGVGDFLAVLVKIERPRGSSLLSIFGNSRSDLTSVDTPTGHSVQPGFSRALEHLISIRFVSPAIASANMRLLASLGAAHSSLLVRGLTATIVASNSDLIENINFLPVDMLKKALAERPERVKTLSDANKLVYLSTKNSFTEEDLELFLSVHLYDATGFEKIESKENGMVGLTVFGEDPKAIVAENGAKPIIVGDFTVIEKYASELSSPGNVLRLFASSQSILNIDISRKIHNDGCPLDSPIFCDFKKLAYLFIKTNREPSRLANYALRIFSCLSLSLPLLVNAFDYLYSLFPLLEPSFLKPLMEIFETRLADYRNMGTACCKGTPDVDESALGALLKRLDSDKIYQFSDKSQVDNIMEL